MSMSEQICRAELSSDLGHYEHLCATDVLRAVAGIQTAYIPLFRLKYLSDHSELEASNRIFGRWAYNMLINSNQVARSANRVGAKALESWIFDVCQTCDGLGYPAIINTPALAAQKCTACNGTGHNPIKHDPMGKIITDLHQRADEAVSTIKILVSRRLNGD